MMRMNDSARERNKKIAAERRSAASRKRDFGSRRRSRFDFAPTRRREIERHARHVGAADSDDFSRWLIAWVWHNRKSTDPRWALQNCAQRLGRKLTDDEADAVLEEAANTRRRMTADRLARWLELTFEVRKVLRITTIGAVDVPRRARKELRRRKDRAYQASKRRARGAQPRRLYEADSVAAQARAEGVSRMTIYRRQKAAAQATAGTNVTGASAAIYLSTDDGRSCRRPRNGPRPKKKTFLFRRSKVFLLVARPFPRLTTSTIRAEALLTMRADSSVVRSRARRSTLRTPRRTAQGAASISCGKSSAVSACTWAPSGGYRGAYASMKKPIVSIVSRCGAKSFGASARRAAASPSTIAQTRIVPAMTRRTSPATARTRSGMRERGRARSSAGFDRIEK